MRGFRASIACGRWLLFAITAVALGTPSLAAEPSEARARELVEQVPEDQRQLRFTIADDEISRTVAQVAQQNLDWFEKYLWGTSATSR